MLSDSVFPDPAISAQTAKWKATALFHRYSRFEPTGGLSGPAHNYRNGDDHRDAYNRRKHSSDDRSGEVRSCIDSMHNCLDDTSKMLKKFTDQKHTLEQLTALPEQQRAACMMLHLKTRRAWRKVNLSKPSGGSEPTNRPTVRAQGEPLRP